MALPAAHAMAGLAQSRTAQVEDVIDPDAVLLSLCAVAIAEERRFVDVTNETANVVHIPGDIFAAQQTFADELVEREGRVTALPARTLRGLRSKVLLLRTAHPDGLDSYDLAESILDDVLRLTADQEAA